MSDDPPPIQSSDRFRVPVLSTKNLSIVVSGVVAIVALLKAKREDIPKIVEILTKSHTVCAVGWTLAIVFLLASVVSVKLLIRLNDREMRRLSDERNDLQKRWLR